VTTDVLTALGGAAAETSLLAAFDRPHASVTVVRRCVDVAELIAAATAGTAAAALVAANLRRLDAAVVTRLAAAGVGVVGLAADEGSERLLRGMGITSVLPMDAAPSAVAAALAGAAARAPRPSPGVRAELADPAAALELLREAGLEHDAPDQHAPYLEAPRGQVVAVWGTTGAPGRTLLATTLAAEAAVLGAPALLADADTYGGSVTQLMGLLDDAPGLAAAARAATLGTLDVPSLAAFARAVVVPGGGQLRVLTGLSRADRWPELRPTALERVLELSRQLAAITVVDCGFCLETDEELSYDSVAPRRNGATLAALAAADVVIAVGAADPVSLARLVRVLPELSAAAPDAQRIVVVNRVRRGPIPGDPAHEVAAVLARFAGVSDPVLLPEDRPAVDAALAGGRLLAEAAPASAYRAAVIAMAAQLLGVQDPSARRRRRRRTVAAGR
jgi:MinD-like ATPase involved in chromosome partitioning or flagellar assembly